MHTGKEGRAEQQGDTELPRAIVHPHDPLSAMTDAGGSVRGCRVGHLFAPKAAASSDQLLQAADRELGRLSRASALGRPGGSCRRGLSGCWSLTTLMIARSGFCYCRSAIEHARGARLLPS